jgi:C1A family cysteine protease
MKLLFVVVLFALVCLAAAKKSHHANKNKELVQDPKTQFLEFTKKYNRMYSSDLEFLTRYENFKANLQRLPSLRAKNPKATFGINKFADMSQEEFKKKYLMSVDFSKYVAPAAKNFSKPVLGNIATCNPDPNNYDWSQQCPGVVTPIYNQGECGSCWAFSATETIESYYALGGQKLRRLSMEQIVDCDTGGQDQGCNGGFPTGAYQYVEQAGGLEPYVDYPYTAEGGESGSCQDVKSDEIATVTNYQSINGETGLYQQTSTASANGGGPVSVCVDASSWSSYTGGVLTSCGNNVDHCVQLVGYANYNSGGYWIVRNSWGTDWGETGFIWIQIGQDLCSIGDYATVVSSGVTKKK